MHCNVKDYKITSFGLRGRKATVYRTKVVLMYYLMFGYSLQCVHCLQFKVGFERPTDKVCNVT